MLAHNYIKAKGSMNSEKLKTFTVCLVCVSLLEIFCNVLSIKTYRVDVAFDDYIKVLTPVYFRPSREREKFRNSLSAAASEIAA